MGTLRSSWLLAMVAAAGCDPGPNGQVDNPPPEYEPDVDAAVATPTIEHVAHFPLGFVTSLSDDSDVTIDVATTIDTTTGTITPPLASGLVFPSVAQNVGSHVMLIEAGSLAITADVTVVGDKPLVLVARRNITINSLIDISAHGDVPGPGGFASGTGPGRGGFGAAGDTATDGGGGGGASFGIAQYGRGGTAYGGAPGSTYGDSKALEQLIGGSGGGEPSAPGTCSSRPQR